MRPLDGRVVVITGASSGIGRAAAAECVRRGARVVLAARRAEVLEELAAELRRDGGQAVAVPVDVADEAAVERLAAAAVDAYGRIDAWVNDAGVYSVGAFEETPPDAFRRVVDVNLFGVVHGSRAAVAQFRRQGGTGVLVNVASLMGAIGAPLVTPYATSKWGVRGFTFALHEELRDAPGIAVCLVSPGTMDTPIFRHAANYTGRPLRALSPVYTAERSARAIVDVIARPRREVVVGPAARATAGLRAVAPRLTDRAFGAHARRRHFDPGAAPPADGNLFVPGTWRSSEGGWHGAARTTARASLGLAAAAATAALVAARRRAA